MNTSTFPISIEIGAALGASLGSTLRSAEAQLGRLGDTLAQLERNQGSIERLAALKAEAQQLGAAWRTAQAEVERFQAQKARFTTKGLDAARARVSQLESERADPHLSAKRRHRVETMLARARERLGQQQAAADERYARQLDRLIAQAGRAKEAFDRVKVATAQETSQLERAGVKTTCLARSFFGHEIGVNRRV